MLTNVRPTLKQAYEYIKSCNLTHKDIIKRQTLIMLPVASIVLPQALNAIIPDLCIHCSTHGYATIVSSQCSYCDAGACNYTYKDCDLTKMYYSQLQNVSTNKTFYKSLFMYGDREAYNWDTLVASLLYRKQFYNAYYMLYRIFQPLSMIFKNDGRHIVPIFILPNAVHLSSAFLNDFKRHIAPFVAYVDTHGRNLLLVLCSTKHVESIPETKHELMTQQSINVLYQDVIENIECREELATLYKDFADYAFDCAPQDGGDAASVTNSKPHDTFTYPDSAHSSNM